MSIRSELSLLAKEIKSDLENILKSNFGEIEYREDVLEQVNKVVDENVAKVRMQLDKRYAEVVWCVEDVKTIATNWNTDQCLDFLEENSSIIQDRSIEIGWEVIDCLLPFEAKEKNENCS